jgi:hypothetical protein
MLGIDSKGEVVCLSDVPVDFVVGQIYDVEIYGAAVGLKVATQK